MELQVLFSGVPYTGTLPQGEALLVTQDSRRACPGAGPAPVQGSG